MCPSHEQRKNGGFTIVEFLIAATLILILLLGALQVFNQSLKVKRWTAAYLEAQQQARIGFQAIVDRVRFAGVGNLPSWMAINGAPPAPASDNPCQGNASYCYQTPGGQIVKTDAIRIFGRFNDNVPDVVVSNCGAGSGNCQGVNGKTLTLVHPSGFCDSNGNIYPQFLGQFVMVCNVVTRSCFMAMIDPMGNHKCDTNCPLNPGGPETCDNITLSCTAASWSGQSGDDLTADGGISVIELRIRKPDGVPYPQLQMWCPTCNANASGFGNGGQCPGVGGTGGGLGSLIDMPAPSDAQWIPIANNVINLQFQYLFFIDGSYQIFDDDDPNLPTDSSGRVLWENIHGIRIELTTRTIKPVFFTTPKQGSEFRFRDVVLESEILLPNLLYKGT